MKHTIQNVISAITPITHDATRTGVLNGFIGAIKKEIIDAKKKATTADLWRIDCLTFALAELRHAIEIDSLGVSERLKELAVIVNSQEYDDDEKALAITGITILNHVGRYLKNLKLSG